VSDACLVQPTLQEDATNDYFDIENPKTDFLEWLRVQMREEAYERYVKQTKLTQAASQMPDQGPFWRSRALYRIRRLINNPENSADMGDDAVLDEMARLLQGQDDNVNLTEDETETENDRQPRRQFPQLFELAKVEGDTEWINWLGKHVRESFRDCIFSRRRFAHAIEPYLLCRIGQDMGETSRFLLL
jgi:hypothetical protein